MSILAASARARLLFKFPFHHGGGAPGRCVLGRPLSPGARVPPGSARRRGGRCPRPGSPRERHRPAGRPLSGSGAPPSASSAPPPPALGGRAPLPQSRQSPGARRGRKCASRAPVGACGQREAATPGHSGCPSPRSPAGRTRPRPPSPRPAARPPPPAPRRPPPPPPPARVPAPPPQRPGPKPSPLPARPPPFPLQRWLLPRCIVGARSVVHLPFDLRRGLVGRKRSARRIVGRYVAGPGAVTSLAPQRLAPAAAGSAGGGRRGGRRAARGARSPPDSPGRTRPPRLAPRRPFSARDAARSAAGRGRRARGRPAAAAPAASAAGGRARPGPASARRGARDAARGRPSRAGRRRAPCRSAR